MADEPDPARLRSLQERLAKAQKKPAGTRADTGTGFSQGELAWRMVIELVTGVVLGLGLGYGLDLLFGTLPIFLMVFALFGFAAGIKVMMSTAKKLGPQNTGRALVSDEEDE